MSRSQLRLDLPLPEQFDYTSWQRHAGVEDACNRLALWSVHGGRIWLTSDSAAGKSHLLHTLVTDHPNIGLLSIGGDESLGASWHLVQQWMQQLEQKSHWLIDVKAGTPGRPVAHALFHGLERARDLSRPVIVAWRGDIESLPPELSSRLRAMERVEMAPPADDAALMQVLEIHAGKLQWQIREQVLQSMLTYLPRRLDLLIDALKELEQRSFEQQHKPGPAWVKQQLETIAASLNS